MSLSSFKWVTPPLFYTQCQHPFSSISEQSRFSPPNKSLQKIQEENLFELGNLKKNLNLVRVQSTYKRCTYHQIKKNDFSKNPQKKLIKKIHERIQIIILTTLTHSCNIPQKNQKN